MWWAGVETAACWDPVSSCLGLASGSEKTKEMGLQEFTNGNFIVQNYNIILIK